MLVEQLKSRKKLIKTSFVIIIVLAISYLSYSEFKSIDFIEFFKLARQLPRIQELQILIFGILAFSLVTSYDFLFCKYYNFNLDKKTIFKIGWISQSFNNFVGFGPPLRFKLYNKEGITSKDSLNVSLSIFLTSITGLSALVGASIFSISKLDSSKHLYFIAIICLYIPIFLFTDRVDFKKLFNLGISVERLDNKTKFLGIVLSTLEWFAVAIFFAYLIKIFTPEVPVSTVILIYCSSIVIGILSLLPGGAGSFDISCVYLFGKMGYDTKNVLISIVIYRIVYYVFPWLISIFLLVFEFLKEKKFSYPKSKVTKELGIKALYYGMLSGGIILIISSATPGIVNRINILHNIIPNNFLYLSKFLTMLIGVMLISLSKGIKERVKSIYKISMILLLIATVTSVLKGLDYEESILMASLAMLLYHSRSLFDKESMRLSTKNLLSTFLIFTVAPIIYFIIFNITHDINIISAAQKYNLSYLLDNKSNTILYIILASIMSLIFQYQTSKKLIFTELTNEDISNFENFINKYGGNIFSHLFYLKDKNIFFNQKENVMLMYRPYKNKIFVLGDPIGDRDYFEEAIDEFIELAEDYNMKVVFYEVEGKNLELYSTQGFNFIKIGEEAIIDLTKYSYEGKENKVLRSMRNMFINRGYEFELIEPPFTDEVFNTIKIISDEWLDGRLEKNFSLGSFNEEYVSRSPIAILKVEGEIIAFCTIMPTYDDSAISIDLMRMKRDHPNGTMDCLFIALIDHMKGMGYKYFSLGEAPLSNVGNKKQSLRKEKLIKYGYEFGNKVYNFQGLRRYKEKFKPRWSGRYIAYYDEIKLPSTLIKLIKVINTKLEK